MNPKIILIEGVPGAGKTTLIKALLRQYISQDKKISSLLHLSQSHTYKPIASDEDNFYACKTDILDHISKILDLLTRAILFGNDKSQSKLFVIIDTLHITHCFRPGNVSWADVAACDKQLGDMNCKLIFIKAMPETIWQRAVLKRNAADKFYLSKYQIKYGRTLEKVHQYYITEQQQMEELIKQSMLNTMTLFSEDAPQKNQDAAFEFWQQD
jgi:thymidylate kinase